MAYSLTLKLEVICSAGKSCHFHWTVWYYILYNTTLPNSILFPLNTKFENPVNLLCHMADLSMSQFMSQYVSAKPHRFRSSYDWKIKTTLPIWCTKKFNYKSHYCQHQDTVSHVFHQNWSLPFSASILQEDILKTSSVIYGSQFYCHEKGSDASISNNAKIK